MTSGNDELEARAIVLFERALERPSDVREDWVAEQTRSDPALRAYVLELLEEDKTPGSAIHTGQAMLDTLDSTSMPDQIGAYRIKKLIGQGGMGAVYLGERVKNDFDHIAAIKVIRRGILSDTLIARFELERQTLANLAHPNIARLFDGGTTDENAPYIIMEYVDGSPITEWADAQDLSDAERLALFTATGKAVQYLHQNLIVHRDITPSNVLVTQSGDVKLIDLGIAKPHDDAAQIIEGGHSLASLTFTPGFAAPERSKGAQANTLSDIFSLGKLLEALLPQNTNGELQAIIAKATQLAPEERYTTVGAFLEDLSHFKSGHAVQAYKGNSAYRIKKFVARNRAASAFGTLAATALISGLIITTTLYRQAEQARQEADHRFGEVRQLANAMMFDVYEKFESVPGTIAGRLELVQSAQKYLDALVLDERATAGLRREAAQGHIQLARITGSPKGASLFDVARAKGHLETAETLLSELVIEDPYNSATLAQLGQLFLRRGEMSIDPDAQLDRALSEIATAKDYFAQAIALDPDNIDLKLKAIGPFASEATVLVRQNKKAEARQRAEVNIERINNLLAIEPDNREALRVRSGALRGLAEILSQDRKFEETLEPLAQAIQDLEVLTGDGHYNFDLTRGKMIAHWRRAFALANLGRNEEAIADYKDAIQLAENSLARDPLDSDAIMNLVIIQGETYLPYKNLGRYDEAENALNYSLGHYLSEYKKAPDSGRVQRTLLVQHFMMVDFFTATKDDVKRCHHMAELKRFTDIMVTAKTMTDADKAELDGFFQAAKMCR